MIGRLPTLMAPSLVSGEPEVLALLQAWGVSLDQMARTAVICRRCAPSTADLRGLSAPLPTCCGHTTPPVGTPPEPPRQGNSIPPLAPVACPGKSPVSGPDSGE